MKNRYDLEDRLIDFGVHMIQISEQMDRKRDAGKHLSKQLIRSGTSPGLHYGEAQSAESRKDFIHKMKVILKELRESQRNLKMINRANLSSFQDELKKGLKESDELIAIFVESIKTAKKKL